LSIADARFRAATATERSGLNDAALHPDHRGMGAIVRPEFREDVLDPAFDGFFRDRKLSGDFLVRIPGSDQAKDIDFRRGEGFAPGVLGELERRLGRKRLLSSVDRTDGLQEFPVQ
jgi:hypothetical protein